MTRQSTRALRGDFLSLWRRWTRIIRLHAERRQSRFEVDGNTYDAMHARLLHWCRELQRSSDPKEESLFVEIESILLPWMSLESLGNTNHQIAGDLLGRCLQIERLLKGGAAVEIDWKRVAKRGVLLAVVVSIGAMLFFWGEPTSWPIVRDLLQGARRALYAVGLTDSVQKMVFGGAAVAAVAGLVVWKSAGS